MDPTTEAAMAIDDRAEGAIDLVLEVAAIAAANEHDSSPPGRLTDGRSPAAARNATAFNRARPLAQRKPAAVRCRGVLGSARLLLPRLEKFDAVKEAPELGSVGLEAFRGCV